MFGSRQTGNCRASSFASRSSEASRETNFSISFTEFGGRRADRLKLWRCSWSKRRGVHGMGWEGLWRTMSNISRFTNIFKFDLLTSLDWVYCICFTDRYREPSSKYLFKVASRGDCRFTHYSAYSHNKVKVFIDTVSVRIAEQIRGLGFAVSWLDGNPGSSFY